MALLDNRMTRKKVPQCELGLTGKTQAATLPAGKIERSAEAFRMEISICAYLSPKNKPDLIRRFVLFR
ncbi:MAG: hypothetical protein CL609_11110 [Anaerolineaceae bacterium]|nr:hypothetical protein [Anaerolineaceae bacterium]